MEELSFELEMGLLKLEAQKIYQAIFNQNIPEIILIRYIEASKILHEKTNDLELMRNYKMIQQVKDLEALELAGRYLKKTNLLKTKFHLMVYLAETRPENQIYFTNKEKKRIKGWFIIGAISIKTFYKLMKGVFLIMRLSYA